MKIMNIFWRGAFLVVTASLIGFVNPIASSAAAQQQNRDGTCEGILSSPEALRCLNKEYELLQEEHRQNLDKIAILKKEKENIRRERATLARETARLHQIKECLIIMKKRITKYKENHTTEEAAVVYRPIYDQFLKMETDPTVNCPLQ